MPLKGLQQPLLCYAEGGQQGIMAEKGNKDHSSTPQATFPASLTSRRSQPK